MLLACAGCAIEPRAGTASQAIVGGTPSEDDAAAVALVDARGQLRCSGVAVDSDVILTAGHCVTPDDATDWSVVVGATVAAPPAAEVVATARHPDYDPFWLTADLALVFIDPPLAVTPLARGDAPALPGDAIRVVGFGRSESDAGGTRRTTEAVVLEADQGRLAYRNATCGGDSGGPLLVREADREVVIGIVSASSFDCGDGVAVDTVAHQPWLDEVLTPASCRLGEDLAFPLVIVVAGLVLVLRRRSLVSSTRTRRSSHA